ncbi:MAG TPA: DsbA family protein [Polyangiales bacterium]
MSVIAPNDQRVRFYFSFRSPYSWLAFPRIELAIERTGLALEYIPIFPPPNFPNDPARVPTKAAYIRHDLERLARAYGLAFKMPQELDCEWARPHAAFLHAHDRGCGPAFARAMFAARFSRGEAIDDDAVIARCAEQVGLEALPLLAAQDDVALQERVVHGMIRGVQEDGLFGVPLLVHRGERFWGNDRIEWFLRHVEEQRGGAVPDLRADPLAPAHKLRYSGGQ